MVHIVNYMDSAGIEPAASAFQAGTNFPVRVVSRKGIRVLRTVLACSSFIITSSSGTAPSKMVLFP